MNIEDIRARVDENAEGDVIFGRDEVAGLLAELDRLAQQIVNAWDEGAKAQWWMTNERVTNDSARNPYRVKGPG